MEIPADLLSCLARDSKFFDHMMGCHDVTTTDNLDDESDPNPDNSAVVLLLSSAERMAAVAYYFMNHVNAVQRCCLLHKLGLPCAREMVDLFEQKRVDIDIDIPHFMEQFPVDARGHIVDSPWGPWFVHWCIENGCRTHRTLLVRMGHTVELFQIQSMTRAIVNGDFVLARYFMRITEVQYDIEEFLMNPCGLRMWEMEEGMARRVFDFLLTEWLYSKVLAHPDADVAACTQDFWYNYSHMLERDGRFLEELQQVMADPRYVVTMGSITMATHFQNVRGLALMMAHRSVTFVDTDTVIEDADITYGMYCAFQLPLAEVPGVPGIGMGALLQCVYDARPTALIALGSTMGDHVTPAFCEWMEANTRMSDIELSGVYLNTLIVNAGQTRAASRALVDLYRATLDRAGNPIRTAMDGVIAMHDALARMSSEREYRHGREYGFHSVPTAGSMHLRNIDELRAQRGADFEPSLSMLFWMQPLSEAEIPWLRRIGIAREHHRTLVTVSHDWHLPEHTDIGCIVHFMDHELMALGVCPPRIIALFLVREFGHDYDYTRAPVARLHALGLIAPEDQPGLTGLLVDRRA
ncbi:MAG: hypothetical protein JKX76_02765 [Colwellia sp.]|nr:hypothetical protein [Colwellia sp.]